MRLVLCEFRRSGAGQPPGDRHPRQAAAARARGFFEGYSNQKFKRGIIQAASGAFGNAATRLAAFVVKGGPYAYGNYPDLDTLYQQQAAELHQTKRAEILDRMQQLITERRIYAPLLQLAFINGVGPRVGESGFGLIPGFAYTGPYEDITIRGS